MSAMPSPETTPPRPWDQITDTTKESFQTFERELRKNVAENKVKSETTEERAAGEWGRSIMATAEASVEHGSFGAAWRDYVASTEFNKLPEHDRALIRVAFVSGWRARWIANG